MIVIVALVVLLSAYFIANRLNRTTTDVFNAREQSTMDALLKAKSALIAYAASEQIQRSMGQVTRQPGALPCPDRDDDGDSEGLCSNGSLRIGRLPWRTIGAEDLRDATGERLWYAVSSTFYKASSTTVVNSDTQGMLTITGAMPANNVVAVVFAPGQPIQGQDRSGTTAHNSVANYLEGYTSSTTDYTFASTARPSETINDRLVLITRADLMAAVEPVVAARIERNVKAYLQYYFNQWGAFPFPAKFDNPNPGSNGSGSTRPQTAYVGDTSQTAGLLPVTDFSTTTTPYPWISGSASKVSGTGTIDNVNCTVTSSPPAESCTFRARDDSGSMVNLRFQVQDQASNVGVSFAAFPDISTITTSMDGNPVTFLSPAITGSVSNNGVGTVTYQGTVPLNCTSSCSNHTVVVTIPNLRVSNLTSKSTVIVTNASNTSPITITTGSAHNFATGARVNIDGVGGNTAANGDWSIVVVDATHFTLTGSKGSGSFTSSGIASYDAAWFIGNEWYRQVYYAVSPGYLPGGTGCIARPTPPLPAGSPSCLMVQNLPPGYAAANDKRAVLILAGRLVKQGGTRPSNNLADYLEGINAPPAAIPYVYENRLANISTTGTFINDRVVVVAP